MRLLIFALLVFTGIGASADSVEDCILEAYRSTGGAWDSQGTRLLLTGEVVSLDGQETRLEVAPGTFRSNSVTGGSYEIEVRDGGFAFDGEPRRNVRCEKHGDEFRLSADWDLSLSTGEVFESRVFHTFRQDVQTLTVIGRRHGSEDVWRVTQVQVFKRAR